MLHRKPAPPRPARSPRPPSSAAARTDAGQPGWPLVFANPALCTLLGRSRAELEGGAGLAGLLMGEHGCERVLESALRAGEEAVLELVRRGRRSLLLLLEGAWMP